MRVRVASETYLPVQFLSEPIILREKVTRVMWWLGRHDCALRRVPHRMWRRIDECLDEFVLTCLDLCLPDAQHQHLCVTAD